MNHLMHQKLRTDCSGVWNAHDWVLLQQRGPCQHCSESYRLALLSLRRAGKACHSCSLASSCRLLEPGLWGQEAGAYPRLDSAPGLEAGGRHTQIQKLGNTPRSHSKETVTDISEWTDERVTQTVFERLSQHSLESTFLPVPSSETCSPKQLGKLYRAFWKKITLGQKNRLPPVMQERGEIKSLSGFTFPLSRCLCMSIKT